MARASTISEVIRLRDLGMMWAKVASEVGISEATARRIYKANKVGKEAGPVFLTPSLPSPAPEAGGPSLPISWAKPLVHLQIDTPGWWLILGDTHFPMHDRSTIELAVREAKDRRAVGVLLNGDIMDMHGITPFFRPPSRERFIDEIEMAKQFLTWLRAQLPSVRIVYREGNHEFRLRRFVAEKAAELYDLPEIQLQNLIELGKHGIEWVQDKRKVLLGKLITLHGHEFRKGTGVNPARLAFLRATATCIVSHHHRSSDHPQTSLDDKLFNVWSIGCACFKHPDYDPYNQWNHGYAMVDVASDGMFSVHNRKIIDGRVV
jgi:predicted phosphodiesterase